MIITTPVAGETREPIQNETFADLGVIPEIADALLEVGIVHPFPIQAMAIPIALAGTDMIGQARTGTGKTLAFGITVLQRIAAPGTEEYDELANPGRPQALIITPTRELALQITRDLQVASTKRTTRILTVYGGVAYDPQLDALRDGVDVVVGTPGRLLDLVQRGVLNLHDVQIAVLDEADEMLDLGFLPDVERLLSQTPSSRQTLLFSATMPSQIVGLSRQYLSLPVNIRAEGHDAQATVPDTTQYVYQAHDLDKPEMVAKVLQSPGIEKVMIFCKTKRACQRVADDLEDRGFDKVAAIHGDLSQDKRERALKRFRKGEISVLVCTDVAARGIDVSGVSHVINYECPDDDKAYVHRIGRTGRAGHKGVALTLVDWSDIVRWKTINAALDLAFDEVPETYSTSPNFLSDFQVPEGTKGKLPGAVPKVREPREPRGGGRGGRDGGRDRRGGGRDRGGRGEGRGSDRPRGEEREEGVERPREPRQRNRSRSRRRLHNGAPVAEGQNGEQTAQPAPQQGADGQPLS